MFKNLFSKKEENFQNFLEGTLVKIEDVSDKVFSTKMLGDGYAIDPTKENVYAPMSGKIESLFPTGHALGIRANDNVEILIHLGIDTVELNGEGFTIHVKENAKVKQGDLLISVDWNKIKENNLSPISILVFTSGEKVVLKKEGQIVKEKEEDFLEISK